MAREFSKSFYNSKEWQRCRDYILKRDNYLCTKCGNPAEEVHHIIHLSPNNINDVSVTLNSDNLICLCKDCHFKEHQGDKLRGIKHSHGINYVEAECVFDENGFLIEVPPFKSSSD